MCLPLPVASFTLDPSKVEGDFLHGGILSHLTITGGVAGEAILLNIFG
jgi:hypothetical protein